MDIGFIGVGSMGAAMIANLVRAGHRVSVWNRDPQAARALAGVTVLPTATAAFASEAVLTMLADDAAVRAVILAEGVLEGARPGCVHAVMATISPGLATELAEAHRRAGLAYVAAPVFGVPAAAAEAKLNIMVAGPAAAVARLQPLFDVLGQRTWPLGEDPAHAAVAKIAGNMMISLAIEAMAEATALTESYGLPARDFLDIVTNTILAAPSYKRYGGYIASGTYDAGFKLTLGLKDVRLALDAAAARGATLPAAELVRDAMLQAIDGGLGGKDWSAFATVARRRAGLPEDVA